MNIPVSTEKFISEDTFLPYYGFEEKLNSIHHYFKPHYDYGFREGVSQGRITRHPDEIKHFINCYEAGVFSYLLLDELGFNPKMRLMEVIKKKNTIRELNNYDHALIEVSNNGIKYLYYPFGSLKKVEKEKNNEIKLKNPYELETNIKYKSYVSFKLSSDKPEIINVEKSLLDISMHAGNNSFCTKSLMNKMIRGESLPELSDTFLVSEESLKDSHYFFNKIIKDGYEIFDKNHEINLNIKIMEYYINEKGGEGREEMIKNIISECKGFDNYKQTVSDLFSSYFYTKDLIQADYFKSKLFPVIQKYLRSKI